MTKALESDTFYAAIYIAGDADVAKDVCRQYCMEIGECVTVTKTDYIYTGGLESGVIVKFINYPRFPKDFETILARANCLATVLAKKLFQWSYTIETPEKTYYFSNRENSSNVG